MAKWNEHPTARGEEKLTFAEARKIFVKALAVSVNIRGAGSVVINLLGFPMAFLPMLVSVWVRDFSNEIQAVYNKGEASAVSALVVFAMLAALYIVQLAWNTLRDYITRVDELNAVSYMKERVLRVTCDVKYKYVESYDNFKERIYFVNTAAGRRVANSITSIMAWLQNIITFVSIVAVLLGVDIWIVVILVGACIPAVVLAYFQKDEEYLTKTKWIHESLMAIAYFFEACWPQSLNEVRFFGAYPWLRRKNVDYNRIYSAKKNEMTRRHVLFNSLADIFRSGVFVFILLIAARRIFDAPAVGIGAFMLVFTMAGQLQTVTAQIFIAAAQFVGDAKYMKDFFYLDELDYEKRDKNALPREKFDIDFQNVSFTYPNTQREILHGLNVRIREGEKVAIVGENGSGKSTFVSLLTAMYEPDAGKIEMGGEDIHARLSATRKTLSAVFQDFARYEASLRENITVSDTRNISDGELQALCERTGAWEFIEPQPEGLDEIVGSFSASGNNLSGGQWQKIALTRGAYREDA
ncbi:MAG: ABC transporter ATP-binding protein/permease, partial [Oscillospiraceae bacterium]|nr:ABC transporter ATP-binding protein/permease [Oscillospiraceae bacterium]